MEVKDVVALHGLAREDIHRRLLLFRRQGADAQVDVATIAKPGIVVVGAGCVHARLAQKTREAIDAATHLVRSVQHLGLGQRLGRACHRPGLRRGGGHLGEQRRHLAIVWVAGAEVREQITRQAECVHLLEHSRIVA